MDETLRVEPLRGSLARRMSILGLTLSEWIVIGLVSGQVMLYTERIHRKLCFLKFSHALFLATALLLYFGVLVLHARKPPRYGVHALRFWARKKYLIARGIHEPKVSYWKL